MNIWLIQIGESLPIKDKIRKMRTAILADKLVKRGHNILWWASAFDHFKKDWIFKKDTELKVKKGLKIVALKGLGYKKNVSLSRYIDHRIIARKFKKMSSKIPRPDILIASMPSYDLAYESVAFAKKNNIPVIVDIRDQWPDIFLEHVPSGLHNLLKLTLCRDFKMQKYILRNATCLVSMMDSFLKWGLEKASREKSEDDRVFYLGAKRVKKKPFNISDALNLPFATENKFLVTFIGTFGSYCNPKILVYAAEKLINHDIHFILGGDGVFFKEVKKASAGLPNLTLTGWLSEDEISQILSSSHIGIVPCKNPTGALPNKTFAYLSAGLPIISSTKGGLKGIIEKHQVGLYYPHDDVNALANSIKRLYKDTALHKKISKNARQVFDEKFDADKIYEEYAEHVEKIVNE